MAARLRHLGPRRAVHHCWPEKRAGCKSFHQSSEPTTEACAMKLTKQLALQLANLLDLSALAPDEDLDRHAVREIAESLFEGRLDSFQFDLLTDWTHKIAAARLGWRRGRPPGKLLVL